MSSIRIHDKIFEPYLSSADIQAKIESLAGRISQDFAGKKPLFISILNGSFMFAADLFRRIRTEAEICFIKMVSYKGTSSSGHVVTAMGLDIEVYDRHVIVLEDIVDTGRTLNEFLQQLHHQQPASLHIAALLHKPEAALFPIPVDYVGFSMPNQFVVGFGLDFNGLGRNYPEIYSLGR